MVEILGNWLRPEDVGLEWGSGRSTLWFAQRTSQLVSVEHDETWYQTVASKLRNRSLQNVVYKLRTAEADYVAAAQDISPVSLDFCLVDGIARDSCALASLPLLKPSAILILDNCNWYLPSASRSPSSRTEDEGAATAGWKLFLQETSSWRRVWTTSGVTDTCLFVKPLSNGTS